MREAAQILKHSNTEFAEIGVFLDQELLTQRLSLGKLWRISLRLIRGGFSSKSIQPEQPLKNLRTLRKLLSAIIRSAGRVDGALMMVAFLILVAAAAMAQPQAAAPKFRPFTVQTPDGVMISAQEWGNPNGAEILFIHGFSQSHLSWSRQVTSELANNFRMITYDIRGHGESDKPLDQAYYKDHKRWAEELKTVIEGAKLKSPVLVGWSYGGRIIAEYLMEYGDKSIAGINFVAAFTKVVPEFLGPGDSRREKDGVGESGGKYREHSLVSKALDGQTFAAGRVGNDAGL